MPRCFMRAGRRARVGDTLSVRADPSGALPPATYTLRSDAPGCRPPARSTLTRNPATVIDVRYDLPTLQAARAYVGTVERLGRADTLAGPAFRLVSTVVAPEPVAAGSASSAPASGIEPGSSVRTFFRADSARPFEVRVSTPEPGREGPRVPPRAGRDAVPRMRAPGHRGARTGGRVSGRWPRCRGRAPTRLVASRVPPQPADATRRGDPVSRPAASDAETETGRGHARPKSTSIRCPARSSRMAAGRRERVETVAARGSAVRRIRVRRSGLGRAAWSSTSRWTASNGAGSPISGSRSSIPPGTQIEQAARSTTPSAGCRRIFPRATATCRLSCGSFPALPIRRPTSSGRVRASIRLYADSAVALEPAQAAPRRHLAPARTVDRLFPCRPVPGRWATGSFPLGVLVARIGRAAPGPGKAACRSPNPAAMR